MDSLRNIPSTVLRGLLLWVLIALLFWPLAALLPGIDVPSFGAVLLTTGLIAVLNAVLWPLLIRVLLPLTVLTSPSACWCSPPPSASTTTPASCDWSAGGHAVSASAARSPA